MNEDRFSHHEPCPRCGSKDNLGVWQDGHKFCFGCRYYTPAPDTIDLLKRKTTMETYKNNGIGHIDTSMYTPTIPTRPMEWLTKYGITKQEIIHYGILWDEEGKSLVFSYRDSNGDTFITNSRYFGTDPLHPKYLTNGHKSRVPYIKNKASPTSIILVEDVVSAIKIARFASSCSLLGATVPAEAIKWLSERFKTIRVWLDMDKASQSLLEASKLSQYVHDTRVILTPLDPKEYSNTELLNILFDYKVLQKST